MSISSKAQAEISIEESIQLIEAFWHATFMDPLHEETLQTKKIHSIQDIETHHRPCIVHIRLRE